MNADWGKRLALVFLLVFAVVVAWYNSERPRVLVLHSYATDYSWTRDVDLGLRRVLSGHGDWSVRWHYMDLKRHPWPAFRESAGQRAQRAIEQWQPDIVIAIDDDAQRYVTRHYVGHPSIRIVFAGINGDITPYGYDNAANVTGILERKPLTAVRDALLQSGRGSTLRLVHLGDKSGSVAEDDKWIRSFAWAPLRFQGSRLVGTFVEWQNAVHAATADADLLLLTNYRQLQRSDSDKTLVPPEEVVRWTEANTKMPLIGTNGFYVEDGGMLAIGTSGYEQGEVAGRITEQILTGIEPSAIAVTTSRQYVVFMRASAMARHDMHLPDVYEAFARGLNHYFD